MANVEFTDYRPWGEAVVLGPIDIAEGTSYTAILINETGLPNGRYFINIQSTWSGVQGKHMELSAVINGVESIHIDKENVAPTDEFNNASGWGIVDVTDGTMLYDLKYTFPNQGGGTADGTLYSSQVIFERKTDVV